MNAEHAAQLLAEAQHVLARADRGADFHQAANAKAVEISDYLGREGEDLDAAGLGWMVDSLGQRVDQLVAGARDTLGAAMASPFDAFTGSLRQDAATFGKFSLAGAGVLLVIVVVVLALRA